MNLIIFYSKKTIENTIENVTADLKFQTSNNYNMGWISGLYLFKGHLYPVDYLFWLQGLFLYSFDMLNGIFVEIYFKF